MQWIKVADRLYECDGVNDSYQLAQALNVVDDGVGGVVTLSKGTFDITDRYTFVATDDNIILQGQGVATQFLVGTIGVFAFQNTGMLENLEFRNIYFNGQSKAPAAFNSTMSTSTIDNFRMTRCRFDGFNTVGASAARLWNLERSVIDHCYFGPTRVACLDLGSNDYNAGNITVSNCFFAASNSWDSSIPVGVLIENSIQAPANTTGVGAVKIFANHFWSYSGATTSGTGVEVAVSSTHALSVASYYNEVFNNRTEYVPLFKNSSVSGKDIRYNIIHDNTVRAELAGRTLIEMGRAYQCRVHDNWLYCGASGMYWYSEISGTSTNYCYFERNTLSGSSYGSLSPDPYTVVRNNIVQ